MKNKKLILIFLTLFLALTLFIIFVSPSLGTDVGTRPDLNKPFKISILIVTSKGSYLISYVLSWKKFFKGLFSVCGIRSVSAADAIEIDNLDSEDIDENNNPDWADIESSCCLICLITVGDAIAFCGRVLHRLCCWWKGGGSD